jgi:hypothetical protein
VLKHRSFPFLSELYSPTENYTRRRLANTSITISLQLIVIRTLRAVLPVTSYHFCLIKVHKYSVFDICLNHNILLDIAKGHKFICNYQNWHKLWYRSLYVKRILYFPCAYTGEIDPLFPFEIDPPFGDAK